MAAPLRRQRRTARFVDEPGALRPRASVLRAEDARRPRPHLPSLQHHATLKRQPDQVREPAGVVWIAGDPEARLHGTHFDAACEGRPVVPPVGQCVADRLPHVVRKAVHTVVSAAPRGLTFDYSAKDQRRGVFAAARFVGTRPSRRVPGRPGTRGTYRQPWQLWWPFGPQRPRPRPTLGTPRHHDRGPIRIQNGPLQPPAIPGITAIVALEKRSRHEVVEDHNRGAGQGGHQPSPAAVTVRHGDRGALADRGRDRPCGRPPAQIPASAANALGSCLGFWRQSAPRDRGAGCEPTEAIASAGGPSGSSSGDGVGCDAEAPGTNTSPPGSGSC